MTDDELFAFLGSSISSVWALELLLFLRREPERSWDADTLMRELRSSPVVIEDALKALQGAELVVQDEPKTYRYQAASPRLDALVSEIEKVYAAKPMTVIKAVVSTPTDKLRAFSDAFKLKE